MPDGRLHAGPREVGHPQRFGTEVEFEILGDELVGLIEPRSLGDRFAPGFLENRAKPGMLEEVTAKGVAGAGERLVACRDPGTALDQVVAAVECRHREIVIERMHLEALEGHDRRASPLPDVADDVAEFPLRKGVDRRARRPMFQIDVARCPLPVGLVVRDCRRQRVTQGTPVWFGRQLDVFPRAGTEPRAVGLRLEAVDLDGPVERQRHLVEQVPLKVAGLA